MSTSQRTLAIVYNVFSGSFKSLAVNVIEVFRSHEQSEMSSCKLFVNVEHVAPAFLVLKP